MLWLLSQDEGHEVKWAAPNHLQKTQAGCQWAPRVLSVTASNCRVSLPLGDTQEAPPAFVVGRFPYGEAVVVSGSPVAQAGLELTK